MDIDQPQQPKSLSRFRRVIPLLYFVAMGAMLLLLLLNSAFKRPNTPDQFGLEEFSKMNSGWHTADGTPFEIAEIDQLRPNGDNTVTIFYRLPQTISHDQTIMFRSKNCTVSVLVGGQEIYVSDVSNGPFYNHSPGTRWNLASIRAAYAGQDVELRVTQAYEDGRAKVDNFYYGDRAAITLHLIDAKLLGCVVSLLIFFVALVFLCAWLVLNWRREEKNHSLLWLALFAMAAACWCLLETNLFQFFVPDLRLIQVLNNMMLVLAGLPLYLYLDSVYEVFRFRAARVLCALDVAYILLSTLFQYLGLWDFHQTLNGAVINYGVVVVILITCLARQAKELKQFSSQYGRLFYTFQQIGILLLGLGLLGDLVRYLMMDVLDRAFIIRLGLLGFIIFFGAGNIYEMIYLVKKGLENDFISQLAYFDGLTKTGNRTAYLEKLQHIVEAHPEDALALVMFDVNNLKQTNDTFGHKVGDELLIACAEVLSGSFPDPWHVYRIGGDEFVAITHKGDVRAAYVKASAHFERCMARANSTDGRTFHVVIAHGVAFCDSISKALIEQAEREADLAMYQNKYNLKCLEQNA